MGGPPFLEVLLSGFFVTGTDTGVGKTLVASALAVGHVTRGRRVAVMKPIETGCDTAPQDAQTLLGLVSDSNDLNVNGTSFDIGRVCPYQFKMPASPEEASKAEGVEISPERIYRIYADLAASSDCIIVEGAGGLLVPVSATVDMAMMARQMRLPLVIVARAGLGTVNHSLLTVRMARILGLRVAAVVLVRSKEVDDPTESLNPEAIRRHGEVEVLGPLPFLAIYPPDRSTLRGLARTYLSSLLT
jgi:dethiobiotin synthetase